jgi:hypothetical protein
MANPVNTVVDTDMKNRSQIFTRLSEITDKYFDKIFEMIQNIANPVIQHSRSRGNVNSRP